MPGKFQKVHIASRSRALPAIKGDSEIAQAFESRDIDQLKQALLAHPQSWKTHLVRMKRSYGSIHYEGNAVHFALQYGWARALDPLHQAGASLQEPHVKTGRTPLQMAAYLAYPAATKWLIKHGAAQSEEEIQKSLALVVLGVNQKSNRAAIRSCAQMLIRAGARSWGPGRADPLPVECLKKGYPYLAGALIEMGEQVPPALKAAFERDWMENLNHGSIEDHIHVLRELSGKGASPGLSWLSLEYVTLAARLDTGTWVGREPMIMQRINRLIDERLKMGVEAQDAAQAVEILRTRPEMMSAVSSLGQDMLRQGTPKSQAPPPRHRL